MTPPWYKPQRPSPVIFLTGLTDIVKETFGYLILFLVLSLLGKKEQASTKPNTFGYYMIGLLAAILLFKFQKLLAWFFTRYWVENNKVILTKGVFVKSRVELPIDKLQTIQIKQNLLHRLTHTCALTMDTAGSSTPEFVIEAMRTGTAMELQQWLKAQKETSLHPQEADTKAAPAPPLPVMHLDAAGLLKLCFSENHIRSLFIISFFVFGKIHELSQQLGLYDNDQIDTQINQLQATTQAVLLLAAVATLAAIAFSSAQVLLRYYGYRISFLNQAYQMEWGLFTRHHKTMPFEKVQYITWTATWLRRKMNLFVLRLHSLSEPLAAQELQVQVPVTQKAMLEQLVEPYAVSIWQQLPIAQCSIQAAYIWRRVLLIALPLTATGVLVLWWSAALYWWLPALWLLYFGLAQRVFVQNYKVTFLDDTLWLQKGIWGRKYLLVHYTHLLHVSIHTSPWQRSHGYANLCLHLPGQKWTIPFLLQAEAQHIADFLLYTIEKKTDT